MSVEVVHHQQHGFSVGVVHVQQVLDLAGPVDPGPPGQYLSATPPAQGFDPHEDRARAAADVLAVLEGLVTRAGRERVAGVVKELAGLSSMHTTGRAGS